MLNGGTLSGSTLNVSSDVEHADEDQDAHAHVEGTEPPQEHKPRAGSTFALHRLGCCVLRRCACVSIVAAEYLARGYSLSDQVLTRAIAIDSTFAVFFLCIIYL